ncbi:riboflavin synthase [Candidatus Micrarchaeota archaeon]|nr:riboflavin synthase [Candidatus Micrarchaeota archaeon]
MKIGIVDTTFSRVDMGAIALDELKKNHGDVEIVRSTVPGIKDLAVECKKLLDGEPETGNRMRNAGCDICMALGMVGGAPVDMQCGHEASLGIQQAKLMTGKHIVEVFVHENEAWSEKEFVGICDNRIRKHVRNAVLLVKDPQALVKNAGKGVRQGKADEGPIGKGRPMMVGIVVSLFNKDITEEMGAKAIQVVEAAGGRTKLLTVPGAFDIPLVAKKLLMDKQVDAVIALGAVVKGETAHDEVVVKAAARKLSDLSLEFRKPVTLGIIGHGADWEEAEERAEDYAERAAVAAISLVKTLRGEDEAEEEG